MDGIGHSDLDLRCPQKKEKKASSSRDYQNTYYGSSTLILGRPTVSLLRLLALGIQKDALCYCNKTLLKGEDL